jgi:enoyl-CoA hydratase
VDEVVPAGELMTRARAVAETIAAIAPLAISAAIQAVARGEDLPIEDAMKVEAQVFGELCATADKREGLAAFIEKRLAKWTGK